MKRLSLILLGTLLVFGTSSIASAQCFGDDGFFIPGTCCTTVLSSQTNLPNFPPISMPADGACFLNCAVEATFAQNIALGAPIRIFCDLYAIPISINGTVNTAFTYLLAKYVRTWTEIGTTGTVGQQVWRFLVNGDVQYLTTSPSPCPVPTCAAAGNLVHLVGAIDYARDCISTNIWRASVQLVHHCGDLSHGPQSARPTTVFNHPDRMFAFVGPAPFNFSAPQPSPQGSFAVGDSVRPTYANFVNFAWNCYSELFVSAGQAVTVNQSCICQPVASSPLRWEDVAYRLDYGCSFPTTDFLQPIPWSAALPTGLKAFPLGTYALPPGVFPSNRAVAIYFGVAVGTDPCAGNFPFHVLHGIGTTGGDLGFIQSSPVLTDRHVDLENQLIYLPSPPYLFTGYGIPFLSTMVWSASFI